jgi:hypothetical protein
MLPWYVSMLFIFAGHETCSNEWHVLSSRKRTAPRTPRCRQKHRWAQQPKTEHKEQQSHRSLSLQRKRRSPRPAPRTRLNTKQKKWQRTTQPSTQPKTPKPKTERQKRPLATKPKKPLTKLPWKEKRHHCKRVLAKSNGTLEGHYDFTEVGVSPSRTQPVISVSAFGQVTFL